MRHPLLLCSILAGALALSASCSHRRAAPRGFVDEARDSIVFDLKGYVHPDSEISIWNVKKCGAYYYFCFDESTRSDFNASHTILMAASADKLQTRYVPLPDGVNDFASIRTQDETLILKTKDHGFYRFNPKDWTWAPYSFEEDETIYVDNDWEVKCADHGEFGEATWFIDKHTEKEYAFLGLRGNIRRIGSTLYVVFPTRIYELDDPSIGFLCDSATTYEHAKDVQLIALHFHRAGYSVLDHTFSPIVHFDNENPEIEKHTEHGMTWYNGGFYVSEFAQSDTVIENSFVASDTLFCALNTPSGLDLVKWNGNVLTPVHHFDNDAGVPRIRYRFPEEFPTIIASEKYRESASSPEERLRLLLNVEPGYSELFDLGHDGNTLLKIRYSTR